MHAPATAVLLVGPRLRTSIEDSGRDPPNSPPTSARERSERAPPNGTSLALKRPESGSPRPPQGWPRDRVLLVGARTTRGFAAGALSVVLALELQNVGYSTLWIGVLLGLAMGGAALWALLVPRLERASSRRTMLLVGALSWSVGGFLLWVDSASPLSLALAFGLGGIVAGTADVGPLGALEQAALSGTTRDDERTRAFSTYTLLAYVAGAAGALAAGALYGVTWAPSSLPASPRDAAILLYGVLGFALLPTYLALSPGIEPPLTERSRAPLSPGSRPIVLTLSGLFAVDAFGGGLVANSLVVYYLVIRFHAPVEVLGVIVALGNFAAAFSLVLAAPLARRFGLVNTMVFTHLPSSALLILFAFSPTILIAAVVWVARCSLSQMDVPTRQSYTQAVVPPADRTGAAGYTTAARSGQALGAPVAGGFLALGGPWLAAPFALAGSVKIGYDVALFARFRRIRPPEELPSILTPPPPP
jgi:MFS family permease